LQNFFGAYRLLGYGLRVVQEEQVWNFYYNLNYFVLFKNVNSFFISIFESCAITEISSADRKTSLSHIFSPFADHFP
jgi:hypothetical protein